MAPGIPSDWAKRGAWALEAEEREAPSSNRESSEFASLDVEATTKFAAYSSAKDGVRSCVVIGQIAIFTDKPDPSNWGIIDELSSVSGDTSLISHTEAPLAFAKGKELGNFQLFVGFGEGKELRNNQISVGFAEDKELRNTKIFVGGLKTVSEEAFVEYFSQFGTIKDSVIIIDKASKLSKGFGFVTFESQLSVEIVLRRRFHKICGKEVEVKLSVPKQIPGSKLKNEGPGLFEPIHGSAPDIAGQEKFENELGHLKAHSLMRAEQAATLIKQTEAEFALSKVMMRIAQDLAKSVFNRIPQSIEAATLEDVKGSEAEDIALFQS